MAIRYVEKREESVVITTDVGDGTKFTLLANGVVVGWFNSAGQFVRDAVYSEANRAVAGLRFGTDDKIVVY